MKDGQSSKTAEYLALFRALESARPAASRLFEDRFAAGFLRPRFRLTVAIAHVEPINRLLCTLIDRRWPGPRTAAVARTRYIDDASEAALADGMQQVVILGAGFDSRAYRLPAFSGVNVFEVDHPSTGAAKRRAIQAALKAVPSNVHFVPIDFNSDSLPNAMKMSGFDPRHPTLVIWEGVSNYLTSDAVDTTLRWTSSLVAGSRLIFTYVHQRLFDAPHAFDGTEKLFATLAAAGEKWTFGIDPADLKRFLLRRGLSLDEDSGAMEYRAKVYGREAAGMTGYEFYRIAIARVGG